MHPRRCSRRRGGVSRGTGGCGSRGRISESWRSGSLWTWSSRPPRSIGSWTTNVSSSGSRGLSNRGAGGFEEVETWLHQEPTRFGSVGELARFLKTVVLRQHLAVLPEGERDAF